MISAWNENATHLLPLLDQYVHGLYCVWQNGIMLVPDKEDRRSGMQDTHTKNINLCLISLIIQGQNTISEMS